MKLISYSHWEWVASLPKEPSRPPKYNINNNVTLVNDYGVEFPNKKIIDIKFMDGEWRYYLTPTDTPWYPTHERNIRQDEINY